MNLRSAAEKRSGVEQEIAGLQTLSMQLEHESMQASQSVDPLKAKREQLARCPFRPSSFAFGMRH